MPHCLDCGARWDQEGGCDCYDDDGVLKDAALEVEI